MPRNNVGNWPVAKIFATTQAESEGYAFRRLKDKAMINKCKKAICIWDGKSKGTRENLIELKERGIHTIIFTAEGEVSSDGIIL